MGIETVISESLLIPNKDKTLKEGGILYFKGTEESKEQKYLEALCEQYGIDVNKKVSVLTKKELYQLLYADEKIKYKLVYMVVEPVWHFTKIRRITNMAGISV